MSAKFELSANAGNTLQVIQQMTGAIDATGKAAEGAVASTKKLNAEAQRIKESVDPQEKINRKFAEMKQMVDAGVLSMSQMTAAGIKMRQEMYAASAEGKAAAAAEKKRADDQSRSLANINEGVRRAAATRKAAEDAAAASAAKAKKKHEAATEQLRKENQQLDEAAHKVRAWLDPQVKLNAEYQRLGQLVKAGKLTLDEATQAGVKYRRELGLAADEHEKGFGQQAQAEVAAMIGRYASAAAAVGAIVSALREKTAEEDRAAQRTIQARLGLGVLSQLASSEADPKAAFRDLVKEARGMWASGATETEGEAGQLLFQLAGAGLNKDDRAFAAQIKAAGTLQNVGGAAEAYSALKTSLGVGEVGSFQEFMSKSLRAAGPAPGSFEQLPIAAARSGGSAKALGINDEFLLAATTLLGQQAGSIDEGGTLLAAFLRQAEKSGVKGIEGVGGMALLDKFSALPKSQQGLGGVFGDRAEAVQAFRTLRDNRGALADLLQGVTAAQKQDLAGGASLLPATDDQIQAAQAAVVSERQKEFEANAALSEDRNLTNAIRSDRQAAFMRQGKTWVAAADRILSRWMFDSPGFNAAEQWASSDKNFLSDETRELFRRQTEAVERLDRRTGSKVTTQQE